MCLTEENGKKVISDAGIIFRYKIVMQKNSRK